MVNLGCGQPCRSDADAELFSESVLSLDGGCRSDCSWDTVAAPDAQLLGVESQAMGLAPGEC